MSVGNRGTSPTIDEIINSLSEDQKSYHDSMVDAGYAPEIQGKTLIYSRPAVMMTNESTGEKEKKTADGERHPVIRYITSL